MYRKIVSTNEDETAYVVSYPMDVMLVGVADGTTGNCALFLLLKTDCNLQAEWN